MQNLGVCFLKIMYIAFKFRSINFNTKLDNIEEYWKSRQNYDEAVSKYYELSHDIIRFLSMKSNLHFCKFEHMNPEQSCDRLHDIFCAVAGINNQSKVLEIGGGAGKLAYDITSTTGAKVTLLSHDDYERDKVRDTYKNVSTLDVQTCNYNNLDTIEPNSYDVVVACYTLKYAVNLNPIFKNIRRLLKPGGKFVSYEILTTEKYNPNDPKQFKLVDNISKSTMMPPLHSVIKFVETAQRNNLKCVINNELSTTHAQWYDEFIGLIKVFDAAKSLDEKFFLALEKLKLTGPGFARYYSTYLKHPAIEFVKAGEMNIITGSRLLVFQKF